MATQTLRPLGLDVGPDHVLGTYTSHLAGPLVLVSGGMHGNEPGGVIGIRRVLARLHAERPVVNGRVVGLAGNVGALRNGRRYIDRDLNRQWDPPALDKLGTIGAHGFAEDIEQLELLDDFAREIERAQGPVMLLDLHSFSAPGVPFIVTCDRPDNLELATQLLLPSIAGLERAIPGTTLDWFMHRGHRALGVEGGQHTDPMTAAVHEASIWVVLVAIGILAEEDVPDLDHHRAVLDRAASGMPQQVTVTYRHGITPDDAFRMNPGFCNLQAIEEGQVLAIDARGEVRAPHAGWILLPLYQPVGNDGFFIGTLA